MHLNYYFLRKLAPRLAREVQGMLLRSAFSQDKDEVVLEFGPEERTVFTVRAILKSDFSCLYFPEKFERARSNSVDLFKGLCGFRVKAVLMYDNERAFALLFEGGDKLVFKLFGNRSNLLHFSPEGRLEAVFNRRLSADLALDEASLSKPADHSFVRFEALRGDLKAMFPTFGKLVQRFAAERLGGAETREEQWTVVQEVLSELERGQYYLTRYLGVITLSLLPVGEVEHTYTDPLKAVNAFCLYYLRVGNLQREKEHALKRLEKLIRQTGNYLEGAYEKLDEISDTGKNEQYANLLMANLHEIPPRAEFVDLTSFYTGEPVRIRLKPDLSPVRNAEAYFRKAKNEKLEVARLQENIEAREAGLAAMKIRLAGIEAQSTVKDLRTYLKENGVFAQEAPAAAAESRFRKDIFMGYDIYIGKNARNNDELTLKHARKEDLWLHAKDVSGSHVVIRHIPGRTIPLPVIERAAELAAWHSKRRNDSLCPVTVTPRKFVRKSKGMAAGAVIVEKESVVMVVPRD